MEILAVFKEKIKGVYTDERFLYILIIIAVAIGSFYTGRMSLKHQNTQSVSIYKNTGSVANIMDNLSDTKAYASKIGSRYYMAWCPGKDGLSPKNLISFQTWQDAERAGYKLADDCPHL